MAERIRGCDRLGVRLAAAFTATAIGAVLVAMALAWAGTGPRVSQLQDEQRAAALLDVTAALEAAHAAAGGWEDADLLPAHTLAASNGAVLTVTTADGAELPVPPGADDVSRRIQRREADEHPTDPADRPGRRDGGEMHGAALSMVLVTASVGDEPVIEEERSSEVVVDGRVVGRATLLFTRLEGLDPTAALGRTLVQNLLLAGGAAALLGVVTALLVAPRLTRPLRTLTAAVDRVAGSDPSARTQLPDAVGELGVLARAVDRMAADLEREDRLRRALVADVAHEVRTPLAILLGEIEALEDGVVPADLEHLASLHEEILRLARLVEDLDAIAAAEAAGLELRPETVDLADVVRAALSGLDDRIAAADLTVDADLAPASVRGDPRRLEQVVRNLAVNAIKFSPPGGTVSVQVAGDGEHAALRVTDDGPGIPAPELAHVFERFWRGDHARGTPGSGVGLAVVAELVRAHGGDVAVENVPGRGAQFTVRVPRSRVWARTSRPGPRDPRRIT